MFRGRRDEPGLPRFTAERADISLRNFAFLAQQGTKNVLVAAHSRGALEATVASFYALSDEEKFAQPEELTLYAPAGYSGEKENKRTPRQYGIMLMNELMQAPNKLEELSKKKRKQNVIHGKSFRISQGSAS